MNLSKPRECIIPVNGNENYGLWVITMCQYRFISYKKCTLLWGMLIMHKAINIKAGAMCEIPILSVQFFCDPKTSIKKLT